MTPHLPFLRAVAGAPHDDLPRLVYADVLEETGDTVYVARAHFIRAQIAAAQLAAGSPERREADGLVERLKEMFHDSWQWDLPPFLREQRPMHWVRGFIEAAEATLPDLVRWGADLFDTCPILDLRLKSSRVDESLHPGAFDALPYLERLTTLRVGPFYWPFVTFDGEPEGRFFDEFMAARVWRNVAALDFSGNLIDDAWLVRFVSRLPEAAFATSLRTLDLSHCARITDAGATALATARSLEGLTVLRLRNLEPRRTTRRMLVRRFGDRVEF